jgi:hypothetical protein
VHAGVKAACIGSCNRYEPNCLHCCSLLQVLGFVTDQAAKSTNSSGSGLWEAQAVLLLWMSILILIPFDLVILDSSVTDSNGAAAAQAGYPPLAAKVMALCQDFLGQPGVCWCSVRH